MNNTTEDISAIQEQIDSTLRYFELFKYPLLPVEIHRFMNFKCSLDEVVSQLLMMKQNESVYYSNEGFYSRKDEPSWSIERKRGNNRAINLLYMSSRFVRVIKSFPFIVSIAISGSLSKYYADEDADIDYFIITKTNRLWIARTLLHLYKKLTFITGHEHYYCMNYFIDESALEIDQKNVYSAIETVTLLPVYNKELIIKLKRQNSWLSDYLPNETNEQDLRFLLSHGKENIKTFFEFCINALGADKLNSFFMRVTDRKWRAKWRKKSYPMENYDQAFCTTLHISKNHPDNYQANVLDALKNKSQLMTPSKCNL
ncbi:MAG: hypothetical protein HQ521_20815 [Bacteroidetes bacterium]|nr:hypothetical protein [Bacteroidota bacterium]